jgi:hypothetical protein
MPQKVLEVGGALGWNLAFSKELGIDCDMVEPSDMGRKVASERGITSYDMLSAVPIDSYDLILMRHVLEHIESPFEMLTQVSQYMNEKSTLTLVLPVEKLGQMPDVNDLNHHLYCWNPQTIHNLLQSAGYSVQSISHNYMTGRRLLLPLWRLGKRDAYVRMLGIIGRAFNARELVIIATKQ